MSEWQEENDRTFVEGIIRPLKESVRLDDAFEMRVMSAVHSAALEKIDAANGGTSTRETGGRGWKRKYTLSLSPIGWMALAASFIGAVFLGSSLLSRASGDFAAHPVAAASPVPEARNAHFILVNESAQQVWLVGDFNGWSKKQTPLTRAVNGSAWTVSLPLTPGRHEYAFIVVDSTGERWIADPLTPTREDEFGTESSIVSVSPSATARSTGT